MSEFLDWRLIAWRSGFVQHVYRGVIVSRLRSSPSRRHALFKVALSRLGPVLAVGARRLVRRPTRRRRRSAAAARMLRPPGAVSVAPGRVGLGGRPWQVPGRSVPRRFGVFAARWPGPGSDAAVTAATRRQVDLLWRRDIVRVCVTRRSVQSRSKESLTRSRISLRRQPVLRTGFSRGEFLSPKQNNFPKSWKNTVIINE